MGLNEYIVHIMPEFMAGKTLNNLDHDLFLQDTAELFFEDVRLPKSALLGEENKGFYYLMNELPQERLLIAIFSLASCEFMFEETRKYVRERKAFGKTLAKLQVRSFSYCMKCVFQLLSVSLSVLRNIL